MANLIQSDLASKGNRTTPAKEIEEVKLSLTKEIEEVRKETQLIRRDMKSMEISLQKEIEQVRREIEKIESKYGPLGSRASFCASRVDRYAVEVALSDT